MATAALTTKCDVSLLLVGKTGCGKSTTGNNILNLENKKPFKSSATDSSVTKNCQFEYSRYEKRKIKVVDMPGLSDSSKNKAEDIKDVEKEATTAVCETPDGYDAFLVVVQFGRQSQEDIATFNSLKGIFGDKIFSEYGILIITHGGDFKSCEEFEKFKDIEGGIQKQFAAFCSKQSGPLHDLWKECNKRCVLFDNKTSSDEERNAQRKMVFDIVDAMRAESKTRYIPDIFKKAKAKRDELIAKAEELVLTDEMKSTLRLLIHDLNSNKLETPDESITGLEKIKKEVQEFITETKQSKVKKMKAVLVLAESIGRVAEKKKELVVLMMSLPDNTENSEVSDPNTKKKIESEKISVKKEEETLDLKYEKLLQEEIPTKMLIAGAALLVLGLALPIGVGVGVGAGVGVAAGVAGRAVVPFAVRGAGFALQALPFSSIPGIYRLKKTGCTIQ